MLAVEPLSISPWTVFLYALFTAIATGLGALPFLFTRRILAHHLGLANAAAAGLMLSASVGLIYEGVHSGLGRTLLGEEAPELPRERGFKPLPKRWVVERTFAWLGRNRRLAKDYEANPRVSEAWVYLGMLRLLVKRLARAA